MGKANQRSIVSPEDQRVTFVELFFDLVFVFSVTQVVGLLHHHLDWTGVGQTILVFWLVWWGWTQFTWALNAADTTHPSVELATLVATAVAFFMAAGIPNAFSGGALWFAIPYVLVRVIGLGLYVRVSWASSPGRRRLGSVIVSRTKGRPPASRVRLIRHTSSPTRSANSSASRRVALAARTSVSRLSGSTRSPDAL